MREALFTLEELKAIIWEKALDLMGELIMAEKKMDNTMMTMAEIANKNSMIAMNNDGIRMMAVELIREFENIYGVKGDGE